MVLFAALGQGSLERAEIYFLDGARAMVERSDWLVPYYQGRPFFDKPPLTYWLIAVAFELFGVSPGSARLVPAFAGLALLLATFALGTRLFDRRSALRGAVVLATSVGFMSFGRVAMSDMLLALLTTVAVWLGVQVRGEAARWALPALGAALGLGFLTKGPIAVLLPGLGLALLAWERRRELTRIPVAAVAQAALLFAALGLGWFFAVYLRLGLQPLIHFFIQENLERFAAETYDSRQSALFYGPAYMTVGAPWSLLSLLAVAPLLRRRDAAEPGLANARFLLSWIALMLVPLSLSRGKIDYYLLPLLPAVSLLIGRHMSRSDWGRLDRRWAAGALCFLALALALAPVGLGFLPEGWVSPQRRVGFVAVAALGALALLAAARRLTPDRVLVTLALVSATVSLAVVTLLVPGFLAAQPTAAVMRSVRAELQRRPTASVVSCRDAARVQRDLLFQERTVVEERCDLWSVADDRAPVVLLLREGEFESLRRIPALRLASVHEYLPASSLALDNLTSVAPERLFVAANFPGPKLKLRLSEAEREALKKKLRRARRQRARR